MRRFLLVLAACGGAARHETVTLAPSPAASATLAPVPSMDLCVRVREAQRAKLREAIAASKRDASASWTDDIERDIADSFFGANATMGLACHRHPRGAWALEANSFSLDPLSRASSAEIVVVLYVDGARHVWSETLDSGKAGMFIGVSSKLASDYDKDGIPELWVHVAEDGVEGGHTEASHVLGFADHVKPYAPAAALGLVQEPRDIDGDGLTDLPIDFSIQLGEGAECFGKADWSPATFLAHALPNGTFSTDDHVAKAFVQSWCPAAPAKIDSPEKALCARLWNMPRSVVTRSCVAWDCALEVGGKPQPKSAVRDCEDRAAAYDSTVPFTLP